MTNQLLAELEMANRKLEEKDKEIDRLNNAFDELEKRLEKAINDCKGLKALEEYISALDVVLKKVKELRNK